MKISADSERRIKLGFFLAPILPCAIAIALSDYIGLNLGWPLLIVAYLAIIFFAMPMFDAISKRREVKLIDCVISGFVIGGLGTAVLLLFVYMFVFYGDVSANLGKEGHEEIVEGNYTSYGALKAGLEVLGVGIFGASIGLIFWIVSFMKLSRSSSDKIK